MLSAGELVWILAAVARGDHDAFERLYAATRTRLYGVALRILRRADLAEEVLQESYLRIWRRVREFDPATATPMTWMVAITRTRALDVVRKRSETGIQEEALSAETGADLPDPVARREMTDELRRLLACMAGLEEERRRMILLAYYSGWTREELAVKFDKPVNTVKAWLRRSLLQIRECHES